MTTKRTYGDSCGMARGLDLVGERWALLVVRELLLGPRRFTDLRAGLPGASPNVLSQRLVELEQAGVVRRRKLPPPAGSWVYELTEWGRELEPILLALGDWALRSPFESPEGTLSVVSAMLTLRTYFDPRAAAGWSATYEVRFGEERFSVGVAGGELNVARGQPVDSDATIETDPQTFVALLGGQQPLAEDAGEGHLRVIGDVAAVERLLAAVRATQPEMKGRE